MADSDKKVPAHGSAETADAPAVEFATLSVILDALNVAVYVSDFSTYELLFVNAYTENIFGRGWAGRRCYEYLQSNQTSPCSFCTNHLLVRDGKPLPPHVWEFQNTTDRRWYLCIDRAIRWTDGRLVRLETAIDISDRKEVERYRAQYLGLVSHDLRGPLGAIMLTAYLLEQSLGDMKLAHEAQQAGQIQLAAKRVERMIRDLVETDTLESPDAELAHEAIDVGALALEVVSTLPEASRARVTIRGEHAAERVLGDRAQLERVLDNLITNALKHSPPDAPVVVEITRDESELSLSVIDAGAGIAAEHQEHIFDRFYRVPGTRAAGLGLGLYIARTIVERHHGRVFVESTPGQGSRFRVALPLAP